MRATVAAAVVASLIAGSGIYAARLTLGARDFGAGNAEVPVCQGDDPLSVIPDEAVFDNDSGEFIIPGVSVANIRDACDGQDIHLMLTAHRADGAALASFESPMLASDTKPMHVVFTPAMGPGYPVRAHDVTGFAVAMLGDFPENVDGAAVPDAPSGLETSVVSSSAVTLSWTAPAANGAEITDYLIDYGIAGGNWYRYYDGTSTATTTTVHGLTSGKSYDFEVRAVNAVGAGPAVGSPYSVRIALPGPATGLQASLVDSTSLDLTWVPAAAVVGADVTGWVVQYSTNGGTTWAAADGVDGAPSAATTTDPQAALTGLTKGSTYLFRVRAVSDVGTGPASAAIGPVALTVPGAPTGLDITVADSATVDLTWTAPDAAEVPITGYLVQTWNGQDWSTVPEVTSTIEAATVGGLAPGTDYWFRVAAINRFGQGAWVTGERALAATSAPSEPRNVVGTAGDSSVSLSWSVPLDEGDPAGVTDYVVEYQRDNGTDTWHVFADGSSSATSALVTGLDNGAPGYHFRVRAVNAAGTGQPSLTQPLLTPSAPLGKPTAVTVDAGYDHATVSWSAPASDGGSPITGYTVTTVLDGGNLASCSTTSQLSCLLTGLTFGSGGTYASGHAFTVTVTARNAEGYTTSETGTGTTSAPTTPGAPTHVVGQAQDGAVTVHWTAPASDGGTPILTYAVTASPDSATCTSLGLSCTVTGLTNGTDYTFTVTATNAQGAGSASDASPAVHPASVPAAPGAPTVSSPGESGTVAVAWESPADRGSAITGYVLEYTVDDGATWAYIGSFPDSPTQAEVTGLTDGDPYRFRVAAVNIVGTGLPSPASAVIAPTAAPGAPGAPTGLTTAGIDDGVRLSWVAPAYTPAAITGYEIQYKCTRVAGSRQDHCHEFDPFQEWSAWYSTTGTTAVVGDVGVNGAELFDGNDYLFRVRAVTGAQGSTVAGSYIESASFTRPTEGCVPSAPKDITLTLNSATAVGLTWNRDPGGAPTASEPPVGCLGQPIEPRTHYLIEYQSSQDGGATWSNWSAPHDTQSLATTHVIEGLTAGASYRFRIQEWPDNDNRGPWSAASEPIFADPHFGATAPGRPTGVSVVPGDTNVIVSWTEPAGNGGAEITGYQVTAYTDPELLESALPLSPVTFPATPRVGLYPGLSNGTDYWFRVAAVNDKGVGELSDVSAEVTPRATPGAPGAPTLSVPDDGTVKLTGWSPAAANGSPVTDYVVQYRYSSAANDDANWTTYGHPAMATAPTVDAPLIVTGLTAGTSYVFRVLAVNAAGQGPASQPSVAATPVTIPTAPTGLTAVPQANLASGATSTYVDLSWSAPLATGGASISGYAVETSTDGTTWSAVNDPVTGLTVRVSNRPVSTTVYLRVRAITAASRANSADYNWASTNAVTGTPPAPPPPPAVPTAVTNLAATVGDGSVNLSWTAAVAPAAAPVTAYSVQYSSDNGSHWSSALTPSPATATTLAVGGLTNTTSYLFRVLATNSTGDGAAATVTATPVDPLSTLVHPQAVRNLAAAALGTTVTVSWTAPNSTVGVEAPVTGYVIQRATSNESGSWTTVASVASTTLSYDVTGLAAQTRYWFQVIPTSAKGNGSIAPAVSATTGDTTVFDLAANAATPTPPTYRTTGTWTKVPSQGFTSSGGTLFMPNRRTTYTAVVEATLGSATTGAGMAFLVNASLTDSPGNLDTSYSIQFDRAYGYGSIIIRPRTAGTEAAPVSGFVFDYKNSPYIPDKSTTQGAAWWAAPHTFTLKVTAPSGSESSTRNLEFRIDGNVIFTNFRYTSSLAKSESFFGLRSWYGASPIYSKVTISGS